VVVDDEQPDRVAAGAHVNDGVPGPRLS
jgi:hypothetical protein